MGEDQGEVGAMTTNSANDPQEIRREIEETRQDLGDTAAALAAKTDVKARAKDKVESVRHAISEKKESIASPGTGDGSSTGGAASAQAGEVLSQAKTKAQENPLLVVGAGAFVVGFLLGRITSD